MVSVLQYSVEWKLTLAPSIKTREASVTLRLHDLCMRGSESTLPWPVPLRGCGVLQGPIRYILVLWRARARGWALAIFSLTLDHRGLYRVFIWIKLHVWRVLAGRDRRPSMTVWMVMTRYWVIRMALSFHYADHMFFLGSRAEYSKWFVMSLSSRVPFLSFPPVFSHGMSAGFGLISIDK